MQDNLTDSYHDESEPKMHQTSCPRVYLEITTKGCKLAFFPRKARDTAEPWITLSNTRKLQRKKTTRSDDATIWTETEWYISPGDCKSSHDKYAADDAKDAEPNTDSIWSHGQKTDHYPQTDAWTPKGFLLPQTPLLFPHARPASLAPEEGLEAAEVDRSLPLLPAD